MSLWSRIANAFRGDRLSREIEEEFQSHFEEAVAQGRDPAEARRAFGASLRLREEIYSGRGLEIKKAQAPKAPEEVSPPPLLPPSPPPATA